MSGTSKRGKGKYFYYSCSDRKKRAGCENRHVKADVLERAVFARVEKDIFSEANLDLLVEDVATILEGLKSGAQKEIKRAQRERDDIKRQVDRLVQALATGKLSVDDVADPLHQKKELLAEREAELAKLKAQRFSARPNLKELRLDLSRFKQAFKGALLGGSIEERKAFLREFIKEITIKPKGMEITYGLPEGKLLAFTNKNSPKKNVSSGCSILAPQDGLEPPT